MKNEALETHAVRYARLIAAPLENSERVAAGTDGDFYTTSSTVEPNRCVASSDVCLTEVSHLDASEFSPVTDAGNLGARQVVELEFDNFVGANGVILQARQSFVSTYLIYQAMAYMGTEAGYWLAALERNDPLALTGYDELQRLTGSMEVFVQSNDGSWQYLTSFSERGPIASDMKAIPFPPRAAGQSVRVRLEMATGSWRIGYAALTSLEKTPAPVRLDPIAVTARNNGIANAEQLLLDEGTHLVTQPGDSYELVFVLPDTAADYQLFLESKGYYYEWMREEWIEEENHGMVALMLNQPGVALKVMAPGFKELEASFEENFWTSRFGTDGGSR
jgi:hypothetical protein